MSNKLTNKQKNILNKWASAYSSWDALPGDIKILLETINEYEMLWMDANRYLADLNPYKSIKVLRSL